MSRQIVLDTETTGLSVEKGDRIIEIAGIEMINRHITERYFHFYVNPDRPIEQAAEKIHGITNEFLLDKPKFQQIIDQFIEFIQGAELIIHNAPFDIGFLNQEFRLAGSQYKPVTEYCSFTDTLAMARRKYPGQHNNLDALSKRHHVDNFNRELHGALIDAKILAQVYLIMTGGQTALFPDAEEQTVLGKADAGQLKQVIKKKTLPVIQATAEEIAAHEAFLEMIQESIVDT